MSRYQEAKEIYKNLGVDTEKALEILKDTFGYVCTFEKRKPNFNKL